MKKIFALLLIPVFSISIGCSSEEEEDPKAMNRIIPPGSTIQMDFSFIENLSEEKGIDTADLRSKEIDQDEGACLFVSALAVTWSNLVCYLPVAVPVAIFQVLRTQIPTEVSETRVVWSYTATVENESHTVTVTAEKSGGEYDWTWSFDIDGYIFITGGSMEDLTSGFWQFHNPLLYSTEDSTLLVEWERTTDDSIATVTFTNNNVNDTDGYDDFIVYDKNGNDYSVRFHDVENNAGKLLDITVYWNTSTEAGGIRVNEDNTADVDECSWDPADK